MTASVGVGLARVTVATPQRRIDVALPETVALGELLPHLLRHAGEGMADEGPQHGGWALRRSTGSMLDPKRSLAMQAVRDGEVLHLVPRRTEWPELAYDDVVEIIASGSRRAERSWGRPATRRFALVLVAFILNLALLPVAMAREPWAVPGGIALGFAAVLVAIGVVLARATGDSGAGAVVAGCAVGWAAIGGFLVAGPDDRLPADFGAAQVLLGAVAVILVGVLGYVGVAAYAQIFAAALAGGILATVSALLCLAGMDPQGAAAVSLTIAIGGLPGYPLLSAWLGRIPMPELPERAEEMLEDRPTPRRSAVFAAASRAHQLLNGLLLAASVATLICTLIVLAEPSRWGVLLAIVATTAILLRARLFPTPRQRLPMLVSGIATAGVLAWAYVDDESPTSRMISWMVITGVIAGFVLAAGLVFSRRSPSPRLGRISDILDVMAIMALLPLACGVVGLYQYLQGIFAGVV
ncbi:type VII secretion integral membrane protein EccD [Virgisporangium aurantiacum]|uniref:Type VII secretion integral membrane protein EccD n=1 Tax=Virgisporangium aurantiacum TaxID=175570 RepID=A0A8J4E5S5_9ACTN|nr:type VII secretion integral membrane protein EccD [Virgisporangium aurantiacum]GIJ62636.1 type VII secretion integral membrane protein EccD [Virgisporangium aurantiacum]